MKKPCLTCGRLTSGGSWCPDHKPVWATRSPSSRATAEPGWNRLRREVFARDGGCVVCGTTEQLEAHHIVPVSQGGPNTLGNVETRCRRHHTHD
jgi:5-methylcytosine-specific restriction endonuclease McrA